MTDNEIMREQNFIDRIAVFKKRAKEFFADYENPNGSEDTLEICLIRDGCRAVSQADEIINRQNTKISHYKNSRDKYADSCMYLSKQCDKLQEENQQLKTEIERYKGVIKLLEKDVAEAKSEAFKEAAERLKEKVFVQENPFEANEHKYVKLIAAEEIDNLLKERVGEKNA